MTTPAAAESTAYEPSVSQLARAKAMRRFNRLFVYTPVAFLGLVGLVLIGLLLWGSLSPHITGTREFASALADIVIILTVLPLMVMCAVVPLAAIAYAGYRRRGEKRAHGRLHLLFWRLESLLERAQRGSGAGMNKLARPVIEGHARAAFLSTLFNRLKQTIKRLNWS